MSIFLRIAWILPFFTAFYASAFAQETSAENPAEMGPPGIPEPLRTWIPWVQQGKGKVQGIPLYNAEEDRIAIWPSRLKLDVQNDGAAFSLEVSCFSKGWMQMPGNIGYWPRQIMVEGENAPVLERDQRPAIWMEPGQYSVTGSFAWSTPPQQIKLPSQLGLLALTLNGVPQPIPQWEADGTLWLQRQTSSEPVDQNSLSIQVHSLLADGIPLWFETRLDLVVSGKSREEIFGAVLPEGWQLASVAAPFPIAVDETGVMKGQVRSGRWTLVVKAFHTTPVNELHFAKNIKTAAPEQTLAFQSRPEFRQAEITGLPQIDATQTQAPRDWRSWPLYRWNTDVSFSLIERIRGPGEQGTSGISIVRNIWLDEDGKGFTFQDALSSPRMTEIRRLDTARGHQLGSVTVSGDPQLITTNPASGDTGFEIRNTELNAVATGRIQFDQTLSASGWRTSAEGLKATLHLPPGYRLFALLGADRTSGDWLSSWSLLDLFLLLLFTLAVHRLCGMATAALAFATFALTYHEPGAPRLSWLVFLIPAAIVHALPPSKARNRANGFKWAAFAFLLIFLAPFLGGQMQAILYPQLERASGFRDGRAYLDSSVLLQEAPASGSARRRASDKAEDWKDSSAPKAALSRYSDMDNLKADPKAVIQTGPGVPTWRWRTAWFSFDGPVSDSQTVRPVFIAPALTRGLGVLRVLCLAALAVLLLRTKSRRTPTPSSEVSPASTHASATGIAGSLLLPAILAWLAAVPHSSQAQFPDQALLQELQDRLYKPSEAFPGAADLASAELKIQGNSALLALTYHAADRCAVPIPIPLNAWGLEGATWNDGTAATLLRKDNTLWTIAPGKGIYALHLQARIRDLNEWEWGFPLRPRRVTIQAEGWNYRGQRPNEQVEGQIVFTREGRVEANATTYERPETHHAILVERQIEMGLVWRVNTQVRRLIPAGRAAVLRIPLLPGEKVFTQGYTIHNGFIEVHLPADSQAISWGSELEPISELTLTTSTDDMWNEQWRLMASPIWNIQFSGLVPVYDHHENQLASFWQPWPGEKATLTVSRPNAVPGATITVDNVRHDLTPGRRQRTSTLHLSVRASLGEEFPIQLPDNAEVLRLTHSGKPVPVRKEGNRVILPLRPGAQEIEMEWRVPVEETFATRSDTVVLPVEAANIHTTIRPSGDRWVLTVFGPRMGPAVRFWGILVFALLVAGILSRLPDSPLRFIGWTLLSLGLIQVGVIGAIWVIAWIFLIRWRGTDSFQNLSRWTYNLISLALFAATLAAIGIFIYIAGEGLLGRPEMYVIGNGSYHGNLSWYSPRSAAELPTAGYTSISVWWFRFAMLAWALWLASTLVGLLRKMWQSSSRGGHFKRKRPKNIVTPESTATGKMVVQPKAPGQG